MIDREAQMYVVVGNTIAYFIRYFNAMRYRDRVGGHLFAWDIYDFKDEDGTRFDPGVCINYSECYDFEERE